MFKKVSTFKNLLLFSALLATVSIDHAAATTSICYSQADGSVFPVEGSCSQYIYCLDQQPITLNCGNDMNFSKAARGCIQKSAADCVEHSDNETVTGDNLNNTTTTVAAPNAETTIRTCVDNEQRPENQAACQGQAFGALVPYPGNCTKFLVCNCEYPTVKECPGGLWFDKTIDNCNYPQAVDCDAGTGSGTTLPMDKTTTEASVVTTTESNEWGEGCEAPEGMSADICLKYNDGFLIRYPYNCNAYINCTMGCPVMQYCQADKVFNAFLKICDTPETAECEELPVPTTTTTEEPSTTTEEPSTTTEEPSSTTTEEPSTTTTEEPSTTTTQEPSTTTTEEPSTTTTEASDTTTTEDDSNSTTTTEQISTTPDLSTPPNECLPPYAISTEICADREQGAFVPYPYDCNGYIVCKWQCPFLEYCETGKIFNAFLGICDTPQGLICDEIPLPTTEATTTTTTEMTTEITTEASTEISTVFPNTTTTEEPQTTTLLPSDVDPDMCLNQSNYTLIPYEADCSKYLQCFNGEVEMKSCPQGWLFNAELLLCDQDTEDKCYKGITTTVTTTEENPTTTSFDLCVGEPTNKTFPYPEDCAWYYYCRGNDSYYLLPCPNNNFYDPISGNCGPAVSPTACQVTTTTTTTTTVAPTTLSPTQKCADQDAGTTFTYEDNCQKYIYCNGQGGFIIMNCPYNNYYYPDSGDCGLSDNPDICLVTDTTTTTTQKPTTTTTTTIATTTTPAPVLPSQGICGNSSSGELISYPDNCQKYISCVKPIPVAFYCNSNWYFDEQQQRCILDTNGSCTAPPSNTTTIQPPTSNICQDLQEGDWQVYPTDCKFYYECLGDGYYMLQICMENEYFDPAQGKCSSQVDSEYCKENFDTTLEPTSTTTMTTTTEITTTTTAKPSGICEGYSSGSKIPYPGNCFKYIVCQSPIPVGNICSEDLQFSTEQQDCVEAIDSDCGVVSTVTPEITTVEPTNQCFNKTDYTLLPYEEDCTLFIICRNGIENLAYCPEDKYFDVWQGVCMPDVAEDACRRQQTTTTKSTTTTTTKSTTVSTTESTTDSTTTTTESTTDSTTTTTESTTTEITTVDPNLGPCYNKPNGTKLPYPNNCEKYIECQEPLPVGRDCPQGLEFSQYYEDCVIPEIADCSIKTTTEAATTTTEDTTENSTTTTEATTANTTTTPSNEDSCDDKPNGYTFSYPNDCSKYYTCINGNAKLTNCMPNTYYDPETGLCDDVSPTACQVSTTTTTEASTTPQEMEDPCTNHSTGYTYPYELDCSKYYMCLQGSAHIVNCNGNTYYNPLTGDCDGETSSTECQTEGTTTQTTAETTTTDEISTETTTTVEISTETTTTEENSTQTTPPEENPTTPTITTTTEENPTTPNFPPITAEPQEDSNICCGQPAGTRLPYPDDSTKYVTCQYPLPVISQCNQGSHFNSSTSNCETAQESTTFEKPECSQLNFGKVVAYEGDCSKYYLCFGTDAMVLECSNNWYFNDTLKQCVPKDLYACPW